MTGPDGGSAGARDAYAKTATPAPFPAPGPQPQSCLAVVAAFSDVAASLAPVVADAAARIMMSPMLGDFIELRFADIGPRPRDGEAPGRAAARIADALTSPGSGVAETYFALVVADHFASAAGQLIAECLADPVLSALPCRCLGLAAVDDRPPGNGLAGAPGMAADIVVPPSGAGGWGRGELIDQLRGYAEELLRDFATGHEPGLSQADLASIQSRDGELLLGGPSGAAVDAGDAAGRGTVASGERAVAGAEATVGAEAVGGREVVGGREAVGGRQAGGGELRGGRELGGGRELEGGREAVGGRQAGGREAAAVGGREAAGGGDAAGASEAVSGEAVSGEAAGGGAAAGGDERAGAVQPRALPSPQRPALWTQSPPVSSPGWAGMAPSRAAGGWRLPRWRPTLRPGRFPSGAAPDGLAPAPGAAGTAAENRPVIPVYLVLCGDDGIGDHGTRARRALLQAVDEQLAVLSEAVFLVRAMGGGRGTAPSQLRPAGSLSRRDLKRPGGDSDLAEVLADVKTLVRGDLSHLRRLGWAATQPAVFLSPAGAPLADAAAVQEYRELVREARVIWVMFDCPDGLLSPLFTDGSAVVEAGYPGALDRAVNLLRAGESAETDVAAPAVAGPGASGPGAAGPGIAGPGAAGPGAAGTGAAGTGAAGTDVAAPASAEPSGAAPGPGPGFDGPALPREVRS